MAASIMLNLRELFFGLDNVIYSFAGEIYDFMINLAKLDLFNNIPEAMQVINRLYIVLGVIMFFRLLLSLVQGVIDPDKIGDKKSGASSIIARTIIVLILIAVIPTIFNLAYKFQSIFIKSDIVYKVLNGVTGAEIKDKGTVSVLHCVYTLNGGSTVNVNIYTNPIRITVKGEEDKEITEDFTNLVESGVLSTNECPSSIYSYKTAGDIALSAKLSREYYHYLFNTSTIEKITYGGTYNVSTSESTTETITNSDGRKMATMFLFNFLEVNDDYKEIDEDNYDKVRTSFEAAYNNGDYDAVETLVSSEDYNCVDSGQCSDGNVYSINYQWFISSAVGILLLGLLVTITFDFALRTIKMLFLQISSPIFISSYIQGGGKDTMFGRWTSETLKTYADIFVRVILIGFLMFCVDLVNSTFDYIDNGETTTYYEENYINEFALKEPQLKINNGFIYNVKAATDTDDITIDSDDNGSLKVSELSSSERKFLKLFLIIGALMFVKVGPKMIMGLFGVKSSGGSMLNPFQKIREIPGVGKGVAAVTGGAIGAAKGLKTGGFSKAGLKTAAAGAALGAKASGHTIGMMGTETGKKPQASVWAATSKSLAEAQAGKVSGAIGQSYAIGAFTAKGGALLKEDIKKANIDLGSLKAAGVGLNSKYQEAQQEYQGAIYSGDQNRIATARANLTNAGNKVRDNQINQVRLENQIDTMGRDLKKVEALAPGGLSKEDRNYNYANKDASEAKREYISPNDEFGPNATWEAGKFSSDDINKVKTQEETVSPAEEINQNKTEEKSQPKTTVPPLEEAKVEEQTSEDIPYRENRNEETEMQQRVNDAANVHDETTEDKKIDKFEELTKAYDSARPDENGIFHDEYWWRKKAYEDAQKSSEPEKSKPDEPEIIDNGKSSAAAADDDDSWKDDSDWSDFGM